MIFHMRNRRKKAKRLTGDNFSKPPFKTRPRLITPSARSPA